MTWMKITQRIDERKQMRLELVTHNRLPVLAIMFGETLLHNLKMAGELVDVFRGTAEHEGWLRVEPSKDGEFQVITIKDKKHRNVCRIPVPDGITVATHGPIVVPHEIDGKAIKVSLQPLLGLSVPSPTPVPTPPPTPASPPSPTATPPVTIVEVSKETFAALESLKNERDELVYRSPAKPSLPSPTPPPTPTPTPTPPPTPTAGEGEIPPPWRGKPAEPSVEQNNRVFKSGKLTLIGSYLFWNLKDKVSLHKDTIPVIAALLKGALPRSKARDLTKKDLETQIGAIRTALRTLQAVKLQTLEYGWDIVED